jgi:hypothetical protein
LKCEAVKGFEGLHFAMVRVAIFQDRVHARHPIGFVGEDQVADDVDGAEGLGCLSGVQPK